MPLLGLWWEAVLRNDPASSSSSSSSSSSTVDVFALLDHGRTAQRCLVWSSDTRRALRALPPALGPRLLPALHGLAWAGGSPIQGAAAAGADAAAASDDDDGAGRGAAGGPRMQALRARILEDDASVLDAPAAHGPGSEIGIDPQLLEAGGVAFLARGGPQARAGGLAPSQRSSSLVIERSVAILPRDALLIGSGGGDVAGSSAAVPPPPQPPLLVARSASTLSRFAASDAARHVRERFVPSRALMGLLPEALLATHEFWARRDAPGLLASGGAPAAMGPCNVIVGYPRRRGASGGSGGAGGSSDLVNSVGFREGELILVRLHVDGGVAEILSPDDAAARAAGAQPRTRAESDARAAAAGELLSAAGRVLTPGGLCLADRRTLLLAATAAPGSLLGRLHTVLSRVEPASHTLVWARALLPSSSSGSASAGATAAAPVGWLLDGVELPRLRQTFSVTLPAAGGAGGTSVALASVEHAGYVLSDARPQSLTALACGLPFSLVLEATDAGGALMLLAPSYPVRRPAVASLPFATTLRPARWASWLAAARSRVFAYPVHGSGATLLYREPSAALYHLQMLLWARQYDAAAAVLPCCALNDAPLGGGGGTDGAEQGDDAARLVALETVWLLHCALATADDSHPNALALRLRLFVGLLRAAEKHAAGGTLQAAGVRRDARDETVASPLGLLGRGNGDPWGAAWRAWKGLAAPRGVLPPDGPLLPFHPVAVYGRYLQRLALVSPACRLDRDEELALQAVASVVTAEAWPVGQGAGSDLPRLEAEVSQRDAWLALEEANAAAVGPDMALRRLPPLPVSPPRPLLGVLAFSAGFIEAAVASTELPKNYTYARQVAAPGAAAAHAALDVAVGDRLGDEYRRIKRGITTFNQEAGLFMDLLCGGGGGGGPILTVLSEDARRGDPGTAAAPPLPQPIAVRLSAPASHRTLGVLLVRDWLYRYAQLSDRKHAAKLTTKPLLGALVCAAWAADLDAKLSFDGAAAALRNEATSAPASASGAREGTAAAAAAARRGPAASEAACAAVTDALRSWAVVQRQWEAQAAEWAAQHAGPSPTPADVAFADAEAALASAASAAVTLRAAAETAAVPGTGEELRATVARCSFALAAALAGRPLPPPQQPALPASDQPEAPALQSPAAAPAALRGDASILRLFPAPPVLPEALSGDEIRAGAVPLSAEFAAAVPSPVITSACIEAVAYGRGLQEAVQAFAPASRKAVALIAVPSVAETAAVPASVAPAVAAHSSASLRPAPPASAPLMQPPVGAEAAAVGSSVRELRAAQAAHLVARVRAVRDEAEAAFSRLAARMRMAAAAAAGGESSAVLDDLDALAAELAQPLPDAEAEWARPEVTTLPAARSPLVAGGAAAPPPPPPPASEWTCSVCTVVNPGDADICTVCDSPRAASAGAADASDAGVVIAAGGYVRLGAAIGAWAGRIERPPTLSTEAAPRRDAMPAPLAAGCEPDDDALLACGSPRSRPRAGVPRDTRCRARIVHLASEAEAAEIREPLAAVVAASVARTANAAAALCGMLQEPVALRAACAAAAAEASAAADAHELLSALSAHELSRSDAGRDLLTRLEGAVSFDDNAAGDNARALTSGAAAAAAGPVPPLLLPHLDGATVQAVVGTALEALAALAAAGAPATAAPAAPASPAPPREVAAALALVDAGVAELRLLSADLAAARAASLAAADAAAASLPFAGTLRHAGHGEALPAARYALLRAVGLAPRGSLPVALTCALSSAGEADLAAAEGAAWFHEEGRTFADEAASILSTSIRWQLLREWRGGEARSGQAATVL